MAAKCMHCGKPVRWIAAMRGYLHKESGSRFCDSSGGRIAKAKISS